MRGQSDAGLGASLVANLFLPVFSRKTGLEKVKMCSQILCECVVVMFGDTLALNNRNGFFKDIPSSLFLWNF